MENNMNNQNNTNLNNQSTQNMGTTNGVGQQSSQSVSSGTTQTTQGRSMYQQATYLRPEEIVKDNPSKPVTPVFAYSKTVQNPYLPQGYQTTAPLNQQPAQPQQLQQNVGNTNSQGFAPAQNTQQAVNSNTQQMNSKNMQESVGADLSFGNQTAETNQNANNFELVGNRASSKDIAKGSKFKIRKRTESRFCGHSAWFFSFANLFVCLLFVLSNILISNAGEEAVAAGGIVGTVKSILDKAPYVTLVVLAFTLIAVINSIIQITIANNKYSKTTICFVLVMNALMFTYLYFSGFIAKTLEMLQLATS